MTDLTVFQDHAQAVALIAVNSVHSPNSRRAYARGINEFLRWNSGRLPLNRETVKAWRASMEEQCRGSATINQALAAVRALAREAAELGLIDQAAADGIENVRGLPQRGVRTGNWLTLEQVKVLMSLPDRGGLRGKKGTR